MNDMEKRARMCALKAMGDVVSELLAGEMEGEEEMLKAPPKEAKVVVAVAKPEVEEAGEGEGDHDYAGPSDPSKKRRLSLSEAMRRRP